MKKDAGSVEDGRDGTPVEDEGKKRRPGKKTEGRTGRKEKYTAALLGRILDKLRLGVSIKVAAESEGIAETTFYRWARDGEKDGSGVLWQFAQDYPKALRESEIRCLDIITRVAQGNNEAPPQWLPAAWLLERRLPELYSQRRMRSAALEALEIKKLEAEIAKLKREAEESKADKTPVSLDITIRDLTNEPKSE